MTHTQAHVVLALLLAILGLELHALKTVEGLALGVGLGFLAGWQLGNALKRRWPRVAGGKEAV